MNIVATWALRVWLEVPDTAWWLQLATPKQKKFTNHEEMCIITTFDNRDHNSPLPDITLIFWATIVNFPSDPVKKIESIFRNDRFKTFLKMLFGSGAEDCLTSEDLEEVRDHVLNGGRVTALLGKILHGLDGFLHQLGVVCLQLTWNAHTPPGIVGRNAIIGRTCTC